MCPECETEHNLVGVAGLGRQKNHRKITDEHFCSDEASVNCLSFSGPVLGPFGRPVLDNSNGDLIHGGHGHLENLDLNEIAVVDELHSSEQILAALETEIDAEVAADSGACDHVAGPDHIPGSVMIGKDGRVRNFIDAQNNGIKHHGEAQVHLVDDKGNVMATTVQVAEVCRPLHSVSKICDGAGDVHHEMLFMQDQAVVVPAVTFSKFMEKEKVKIITTHPRRGGLYVQKVKVRDPSAGNGMSFPRPGPSR